MHDVDERVKSFADLHHFWREFLLLKDLYTCTIHYTMPFQVSSDLRGEVSRITLISKNR